MIFVSLNLDIGEKLMCNLCQRWIEGEAIVWFQLNESGLEIIRVECDECCERK